MHAGYPGERVPGIAVCLRPLHTPRDSVPTPPNGSRPGGLSPGDMLFLSNIRGQLDAAREAGMRTTWPVRDREPEARAAHPQACDFGAILINPETKLAEICDLCEDQEDGPQCIKWCPKEALELTTPDQRAQRARRKLAVEEVLGPRA